MTLVEASVKGVHYFVLTSLKFKKIIESFKVIHIYNKVGNQILLNNSRMVKRDSVVFKNVRKFSIFYTIHMCRMKLF